MADVPNPQRVKLAALVLEPGRIAEVPPAEAVSALAELAAIQVALAARAAVATVATSTRESLSDDRLLMPSEVAAIFNRSIEWVYRRARTRAWESFTRREGRKTVRFSERGLRRHMSGKRG